MLLRFTEDSPRLGLLLLDVSLLVISFTSAGGVGCRVDGVGNIAGTPYSDLPSGYILPRMSFICVTNRKVAQGRAPHYIELETSW